MLLFLDACIRGEKSRTKRLCERFFEEQKRYNSDTVEVLDLSKENFSPLTVESLKRRDELIEAGRFDDKIFDAARQFFDAEKIVIGAPLWDNSYPAVLKNYVEQICISGLNFSYTMTGPKALCRPKKVLYICTSGGKQVEENFGFAYIKSIMRSFFGSTDLTYVSAEMLDVIGVDIEAQMKLAESQLAEIAKTF